MAKSFYERAKQPGIMLLNTQLGVVGWVPITDAMRGRLRGTGGLNAVYRAISESNAGAAIVVHGGEFDRATIDGGIANVALNIGAALRRVDVRALDVVNAVTGESRAEKGLQTEQSTLLSVANDARANQTTTPAFAKWFGESKVVDANGQPLVVYRGGATENWRDGSAITEFRSANGPWAGFFTSKQDVASRFASAQYAMTRNGGAPAGVFPVYLNISRPLEVDAGGRPAREFQIDASTIGKKDSPLRERMLNGEHDGLILRNTKDEGDVFVPLHPEQIKSATGNNGDFDPTKPDIRLSISPERAMTLNTKMELPSDPLFAEAVANTPGASITKDGLLMDVTRFQKPEQVGDTSVRTGVFYLPEGSAQLKHYKGGKSGYGGTEKFTGTTLIRRPLFVKGATGGKAPEAAYNAIKGKGAYEALRSDFFKAVGYGRPDASRVGEFLDRHGADSDIAWEMVRNSSQGNQLAYAATENIVAHAVRAAGYDAVIGHSKGKAGPFIAEVFDVREVTNPAEGMEGDVHPDFEQNNMRTAEGGSIEVKTTPASADHERKAEKLLERLRANQRSFLSFQAVEPAAEGETGQHLAAVRTAAKRLFGHDVVFVRFNGPAAFNGAMSHAIPNTVFIRIDSAKPHMAVLGHELLHALRRQNPVLYRGMENRLMELLADKHTEFYDDLSKSYEAIGRDMPEEWHEELWADVVGDNFLRPEFWQGIAAEQPGLFRRVANAITRLLDGIIQKLGNLTGFGTDQFLTDAQEARRVVTAGMRQFSQAMSGQTGIDGVASKATALPKTDSPAFRRWFKDSKVVDDAGKPLVMYHGTNKSEGGDAFRYFGARLDVNF